MRKKIFAVATAHLDTVWNWTLEKTIREFIPKTLHENFDKMERYPDYRFNFEGAYRYELMEEYYPEEFKKLVEYVKKGRWYPCGSAYENGDVNVPSPEALFRNILIGNNYFQEKFGMKSHDIYLPDCFGFGWALPAIMRHAGLKGFSTQKLTWVAPYGIPFDLGKWYGVNGQWVYGALNMRKYSGDLQGNMPKAKEKLANNEKYGLDCTAVYHGTGDTGGSPEEKSVAFLQKEIDNKDAKYEIISARIDDVYDYLDVVSDKTKLPEHKNELTLTFHGAAGYTSRAIGKRWNKRNEILATLAERASVDCEVTGEKAYPQESLNTHWKRVLAHQFHDDLPGTSLQKVYKRSWNDYMVSLKGFTDEYTASVGAIANKMDTTGEGVSVVVHNGLAVRKQGVVEATIDQKYDFITVLNAGGEEVPSQVAMKGDEGMKILFLATVPSFGYEKYTVLPAEKPYENENLQVEINYLENEKYIVKINGNGDVFSIFDKKLQKELLEKPIVHDIYQYLGSPRYPAWEILYYNISGKPRFHSKFVSSRIVEQGGARVAVEITQKYGDSLFVTKIALSAKGEGVEYSCDIDWRSFRRLLKHRFSFTASNPKATYDLGLGTIKRGNNTPKMYEVCAQSWADITAEDNSFGVSVLSDCKFGWDKPKDNTLRLTAIHTPLYNFHKFGSVQSKLELGRNRYGFMIFSHAGEVGMDTQAETEKYLVPMTTFTCDKHEGSLGKVLSFGVLSAPGVLLKTMKKAENGVGYVVRFYECDNMEQKGVSFTYKGLTSAKEILASEEIIGDATVSNGSLIFDMKPYEVKSFLLTLQTEELTEEKKIPCPIEGENFFTTNENRGEKEFSLPEERRKENIVCGGVPFTVQGVLACEGQTLALPEGTERVYLLACSLDKDTDCVFEANGEHKIKIACATEALARWDLIGLGETANIKKDVVAFEFTHTHNAKSDNIGNQFYLYKYMLEVNGTTSLTLPKEPSVLLFALTCDSEKARCILAENLFDTDTARPFDYKDDLIEKWVEKIRVKYGDRREG